MTVNVIDYGADKTGVNDSTLAFRAAAAVINAATGSQSGNQFYVPYGEYRITGPIKLKPCEIYHEKGARIIIRPGGEFNTTTISAVYYMNTTNGTNWDTPNPLPGRQSAKNIFIDNTIQPSLKVGALYSGGAIEINNLITRFCWFNHRRTSNYADHQVLNTTIAEEFQDNESYAFSYSIGDGVSFTNLSGGRYAASATDKLGYWYASSGGFIDSAIWHGELRFSACRAFRISSFHCELGRISNVNSSLNIIDGYMWHRYEEGVPSARIYAAGISQGQVISVKNVKFMSFFNLDGRTVVEDGKTVTKPITINKDFVDIQIAVSQTTEIENSFRCVSSDGGLDGNLEHGISINKYDETPLIEWNEYSWLLSRKGRILPNYHVEMNHIWPSSQNNPTAAPNLGGATTDSRVPWSENSGTYYYAMRVLYDRGRLIGMNSSANINNNVTLTNGGNGALINVAWLGNQPGGWVRLYRGTTNNTSSYSQYVDIPVVYLNSVFDSGHYVNGYAWKPRTPSAPDIFYDVSLKSMIEWKGDTATVSNMPAIPTVGTWKVGDRIEAAASGIGSTGWICTAADTPGTWKQLGTEIVGGAGATITYASAMPTTGSYVKGAIVYNTSPSVSSSKILIGWSRLVTGTSHTSGVDWSPMYVSTV